MKKVLIFSFAFMMLYCNKSEEIINQTTNEWQWVKQLGATQEGFVRRIAVDGSNNIFIAGAFSGMINNAGNQILSNGEYDFLTAKLNSSGDVVWIRTGGGSLYDYAMGISADVSGNCYTSIMFQGTIDLANTKITSRGDYDILLIKYDQNGVIQWIKQIGGTGIDQYPDIATNASGDCYLLGEFSGTVLIDGITLTSLGSTDLFIAKYDPSGNIQWLQHAGGTDDDMSYTIKADNLGNTYIIGKFKGTASFGSYKISSAGGWDVYIAKLNANGNFQWVKRSMGPSTEDGWGITVDKNGNCYVTGDFYSRVQFDTTIVTTLGKADIYIAKYNSNGIMQWFRRAGGYNEDLSYCISVDDFGNCYITGMFKDFCDFGNIRLFSQADYDICIAELNSSGDFLWAKQAGGNAYDVGLGICVDKSGDCIVGGFFGSSAKFGSTQLNCEGLSDGFIGKLKH
jgi:hypothetical protein